MPGLDKLSNLPSHMGSNLDSSAPQSRFLITILSLSIGILKVSFLVWRGRQIRERETEKEGTFHIPREAGLKMQAGGLAP